MFGLSVVKGGPSSNTTYTRTLNNDEQDVPRLAPHRFVRALASELPVIRTGGIRDTTFSTSLAEGASLLIGCDALAPENTFHVVCC
jgi:hypothetical protein